MIEVKKTGAAKVGVESVKSLPVQAIQVTMQLTANDCEVTSTTGRKADGRAFVTIKGPDGETTEILFDNLPELAPRPYIAGAQLIGRTLIVYIF